MAAKIPEDGFTDPKGLMKWFADLSEDEKIFARAIGQRSAMRVLPLAARALYGYPPKSDVEQLFLSEVRSLVSSFYSVRSFRSIQSSTIMFPIAVSMGEGIEKKLLSVQDIIDKKSIYSFRSAAEIVSAHEYSASRLARSSKAVGLAVQSSPNPVDTWNAVTQDAEEAVTSEPDLKRVE